MVELWKKRLSNLLCVKSIVTIILTLVFAFLAVTGQVASGDFLTIFSVIIAFYFGTQSQRLNDRIEKSDGQSNSPKRANQLGNLIRGVKLAWDVMDIIIWARNAIALHRMITA